MYKFFLMVLFTFSYANANEDSKKEHGPQRSIECSNLFQEVITLLQGVAIIESDDISIHEKIKYFRKTPILFKYLDFESTSSIFPAKGFFYFDSNTINRLRLDLEKIIAHSKEFSCPELKK